MIIYAGIDGTSAEEETYQTTFRNSFVNRLGRSEIVRFDDAFYHRGPYTDGTDTRGFAQLAFDWVVGKWYSNKIDGIFLAGYSRGAAAVTEVAKWLEPLGIPVECLILFDAVDRSISIPLPNLPGLPDQIGGGVGGVFENTKIPANVRQTIHPMRDIPSTLSRITFQRCGQKQDDPTMPHHKKHFFVTHGGAGGVPWTTATNPYTEEARDTIWEYGEVSPTRLTPVMDAQGAVLVELWTFPQIRAAHAACVERSKEEQPVSGQPVDPGGQYPGNPGNPRGPYPGNPGGGRIHVVEKGDWLSKIAIKYYGDMNRWPEIHQANRATIGPNPNAIEVGQRLVIP